MRHNMHSTLHDSACMHAMCCLSTLILIVISSLLLWLWLVANSLGEWRFHASSPAFYSSYFVTKASCVQFYYSQCFIENVSSWDLRSRVSNILCCCWRQSGTSASATGSHLPATSCWPAPPRAAATTQEIQGAKNETWGVKLHEAGGGGYGHMGSWTTESKQTFLCLLSLFRSKNTLMLPFFRGCFLII